MSAKLRKTEEKRKVLVKDLNPMLVCSLCEGYLVDATVLSDCLHVFCRGCIIKYFDNYRTACPNCNILYKKKNQICFRPDPQLQSLVYKLVPNLYSREMQTREDFYRSTGVRASSSCSDDSVIDKERDNLKDQEASIMTNIGDKTEFFSPEDTISLSIEYYQANLDTTSSNNKNIDKTEKVIITNKNNNSEKVQIDDNVSEKTNTEKIQAESVETNVNSVRDVDQDDSKVVDESNNKICVSSSDSKNNNEESDTVNNEKRFLKCPAAVTMQLLQKFLRMKFGLTADHRVDIIYKGEVLPNSFTLIDVAYTFKWTRTKPMRFFYRIFTPMKIKPIKIINTSSSSGSKQLQIVPLDQPSTNNNKIEKNTEKAEEPLEKMVEGEEDLTSSPQPKTCSNNTTLVVEDNEDQSFYKERLMANLQLQSTHKKIQTQKERKEIEKETCVYEYVEPDKEELKRFAERRDREWALQKKQDEKNNDHYFGSKKRKKSKHSKNESVHKKRKLHAEITSNEEEDLKLKVKLTTTSSHNSHKHKHHKNSQSHQDKNHELSAKEKLLQMRQVRHKHVGIEDVNNKTVQAVVISPKTISNAKQIIAEKLKKIEEVKKEDNNTITTTIINNNTSESKVVIPSVAITTKSKNNDNNVTLTKEEARISVDNLKNQTVSTTTAVVPNKKEENKKPIIVTFNNNNKRDVNNKTTSSTTTGIKEWGNLTNKNLPSVKIEKLEDDNNKQLQQKTFLKSFQSYTEKYQIKQNKKMIDASALRSIQHQQKSQTSSSSSRPLTPLEKQISSIHKQCTIEAKRANNKADNKTSTPPPLPNSSVVSVGGPKFHHSTSGFTVSKVQPGGIKRKAENEGQKRDDRPPLEITLIPPTAASNQAMKNNTNNRLVGEKTSSSQKRPLPSTIPLEKIKRSVGLMKSDITIIPKTPIDVRDNIGALDLSNKSPESSPKPTHTVTKTVTGINMVITTNSNNNRTLNNKLNNNKGDAVNNTVEKPSHQLSNLQMLSKVASEHPTFKIQPQQTHRSTITASTTTIRPTLPNLQSLGVTVTQSGNAMAASSITTPKTNNNLSKLPKLTEINKTQFNKMTTAGGAGHSHNQQHHHHQQQHQQVRATRPNQNQNIRNIPNPSLLVRQQNQNRLNSLSANVEKESASVVPNVVSAKVNSIVEKKEIPV